MLISGGILASAGFFMAGASWQLPIIVGLSAVICVAGWILERSLAKKAQEPWCGTPRRGIRVLDVRSGSIAQKMGLRPGDVLLRINGAAVMQEIKIDDTLEKVPSMIWVDYEREGRTLSGEHTDYEHGISDLGFVPLARNMDLYMESVQPSWLWFSRR
ncbi:MAG: PDZ domain-containing protein [Clostridiales bacterium]|nr:PDZ domain-containing protein [Clostridiales bacterium]